MTEESSVYVCVTTTIIYINMIKGCYSNNTRNNNKDNSNITVTAIALTTVLLHLNIKRKIYCHRFLSLCQPMVTGSCDMMTCL